MLHELLFVLMGYSGDVFIPYPPFPDTPKTFSIPSEFPFFHPTERECLNRLGHLGWIYSQINNFTNTVKETRSNVNGTKTSITTPHGAYVLALVSSIETTLDEYRQTILDMENRILNKEEEAGANVVPLSLLTANLSKWESLLPSIWKLLLILQESPSEHHGCKLFNLLMDQARTGLSDYRCEIEKMMVQVHNVLYRQLTAWMVYGQLSDPEDEFFIVPYTAAPKSKDTSVIAAAASSTAGWNRLYVIDYERIPLHLSHEVVEAILFIGKSIATVKEMNKLSVSVTKREEHATSLNSSSEKINIPDDMTKKHLQLLLTLHNPNKLQQQLNSASSPSPWIKYPQELKKIVSEIRRSTADWLFSRVLVGDHGLHKYLNSFRHLFLLNYGDLATNFIHQCSLWRKRSLSRPPIHAIKSNTKGSRSSMESPSVVNKNPTKTAMLFRHQELNALFGKSAIGTDAEDQLSGYTLLLDEEKTKEYPFSDLLLLNIRIVLTYDLKWPIDLFLSESDLKKYSNLWSLLIGVKNTQLTLNNLWKLLRTGNADSLDNPETIVSSATKEASVEEDYEDYQELLVWRLRSSMLFWIDTVWNHIQTNVIDIHYQELIDTITPSNTKRRSFQPKAKLDFEEIQAAHEYFLTNIINGCLLGSKECIETVHDILQVCLTFSEKMERISEEGEWRKSKRRKTLTKKTAAEIMSQWTKSSTDCTWIEEVKSMEEEFISKTEQFFNIASLQQPEVKSSGRLDVLLMQLDYNKWFSSQQAKANLYPNGTSVII